MTSYWRRGLMWVGVGTLFIVSIVCLWAFYGTHTITLTEAQVQERINKQLDKDFPVKGAAHLLVKSVSIKGATVHIQDGQILALIDLEGSLRAGKKFALTAYAVGMPTYASGEFFFKPDKVEVQKFTYEGSTPTELFSRFAERYVSSDTKRQLIEDNAGKVEGWMTAIAQNAATRSLEQRPVYRPKDDVKGLLIRASLESVKVEQDRIVITFSLWQFTLSVLFGVILLIAAIGLAIAMMQHPFWGMAFILLS